MKISFLSFLFSSLLRIYFPAIPLASLIPHYLHNPLLPSSTPFSFLFSPLPNDSQNPLSSIAITPHTDSN